MPVGPVRPRHRHAVGEQVAVRARHEADDGEVVVGGQSVRVECDEGLALATRTHQQLRLAEPAAAARVEQSPAGAERRADVFEPVELREPVADRAAPRA